MCSRGSAEVKIKHDFVSREHIAGNRNIRERNTHQVQAMPQGMTQSYIGFRETKAPERFEELSRSDQASEFEKCS